ncbi:GNAT family N-acetyltransferase [Undibacterium sp. TS12]|uniref:GNAT family N-acetyltransferase n=1 Tax=Undibacterium sp. TS12 TaxID=2908202 RepID=UPI001F4CE5E7|nr:GNAT family N-acetyltransferase [Undibacterium sp. TS12]MCH8618054.1 GNAT family N-acetyltransferase [Undibacterium sp. TS12]
MTVLVRPMQAADLAAVFRIQTFAYVPAMVEAEDVLAARLAAAPATAWVAEEGRQVIAYLAAYPSLAGRISALGHEFAVADPANALYLHDMAVEPRHGGRGVASLLLDVALDYARRQGWRYACLVSVQSTQTYWQRLGFAEFEDPDEDQRAKLGSYTGLATYMYRELTGAIQSDQT